MRSSVYYCYSLPFLARAPYGSAREAGDREPPGDVALRCARYSAVLRALTDWWYADRMDACSRENGARCEGGRLVSVCVIRRPASSSWSKYLYTFKRRHRANATVLTKLDSDLQTSPAHSEKPPAVSWTYFEHLISVSYARHLSAFSSAQETTVRKGKSVGSFEDSTAVKMAWTVGRGGCKGVSVSLAADYLGWNSSTGTMHP